MADDMLRLFKQCEHKYQVWDPKGWASDNRKIWMTCGRFAGDALANGCGVEDCPLKPKPSETDELLKPHLLARPER